MREFTHSLNYRMTERFTFQRYERFSEDVLPMGSVLRYDKSKNRRYKINSQNVCFEEFSKETFRYVRFEVDNPYYLHTMIPSARGYNSNSIFLYEVNARFVSIYVYTLQEDRFYLVHQQPNESFDEEMTQLWIVYDRGKIGEKYGDFGFILSLLDCGHLLQQGKMHSSSLKKSLRTYYGGQLSKIVPWDAKMGCVLARVDLREYKAEGELLVPEEAHVNNVSYLNEVNFLAQDGWAKDEVLNLFLNKYIECEPWMEEYLFDDDALCSDFISIARKRTSSQSVQGYSFMIRYLEKEEVCGLILHTQKLINYSAYGDFLSVNILVPTKDDIEIIMVFKDRVEINNEVELDFNEVLHDSKEFFELRQASVMAYTKINYDVLEEDESIYAYCMMQSGEIIHGLSLYLTRFGLSTRPMKNINEKYLEISIKEDCFFPSYLLVAGKSHNYTFFNTF